MKQRRRLTTKPRKQGDESMARAKKPKDTNERILGKLERV